MRSPPALSRATPPHHITIGLFTYTRSLPVATVQSPSFSHTSLTCSLCLTARTPAHLPEQPEQPSVTYHPPAEGLEEDFVGSGSCCLLHSSSFKSWFPGSLSWGSLQRGRVSPRCLPGESTRGNVFTVVLWSTLCKSRYLQLEKTNLTSWTIISSTKILYLL